MKVLQRAFLLLALCGIALAQNDKIQQFFWNGSLLQYSCEAPPVVAQTSVSKADSTLTNIVVSSNVGTVTTASAHSLWVGALVTVSGSSTTALNGTYVIASVPSTTSYTIATSGVSNATYTTGLVISTSSPLYTAPTWRVKSFRYDGSNNLISVSFSGPSANFLVKCSDRSLY
jgi:hypothetical protein